MASTSKLDLELLQNGAANQTLANETFHQLNQLVQAGAVDRTNTPPGSPANEALYIITATATGAWAGKEDQLAYWLTSSSAWTYIVPREGFLIHVNDEDTFYKFDGSAWAAFSGGGMSNPMTTTGDIIIGGASGTPTSLAAGTDGYVLTLAAGSPTWAPASGGVGASLPVVQALSSTRNLVLADINTFNVNSTTNNYTATIPPQSSVTWTADAEIHFLPSSTGDIVITAGAGVSLNGVVAGSITLSTAFGASSMKRIEEDSWWLGGVIGEDLKVAGPASAVDNEIARFDGATGKLVKAGLKYQSSVTDVTAGALVIQGGSNLSKTDTVAIGYDSGSGGTVTQVTSKTTSVTLNKLSGQITTHNASLAVGATVTFFFFNNKIAAADVVLPVVASVGTYTVTAVAVQAGACALRLTNINVGALAEAVVINFVVIKGAIA